jgi:flagellar biosynthesis/type III secretory pathway protein FliH
MSTASPSPEAKTPETAPLDETEITRLISAARAETYRPSETAPRTTNDGFRAKSLMDIARMRQEAARAAQVPNAALKDEAEAAADDRTQIETGAHGNQQDAVIPDAVDGARDVSKRGATAIPCDEPIPEAMEPAGNGDSQEAAGAHQASPIGASGQPAAIDPNLLEQVRDEAFAEGRAAAEAEMHSHLTDAIAVLRAAATALMHPAPDALAGLQSEIADTVLRIASERAGLEIDSMPDAFVERIATLAERIYQATNQPVLRLNPHDHSAIAELIECNDSLSTMRIIASGELERGDIELVVDGLSISDRITPARTSRKTTRKAAKPKSRAIDT